MEKSSERATKASATRGQASPFFKSGQSGGTFFQPDLAIDTPGDHLERGVPTGLLQPRLEIGPVDDPLERGADAVADWVTQIPEPAPSRSAAPVQVSRKEDAEKELQAKFAGTPEPVGAVPSIVHEVLGSPGEPLDHATRAFFEPRLGRDLSDVRVHTDRRAAASAHSIGASAFTVGSSIAFGAGRYDPTGTTGRHLLAHELAHVVQQGALQLQARSPGRSTASAGGIVQRQADPHADFQAALLRSDFDAAALALNGMSQSDIAAEVNALASPIRRQLFKGAMRTMLLWPPPNRVADSIQSVDIPAARQGRIDFFEDSVGSASWREAALALNGFSDLDIILVLAVPMRTSAVLTQLRDAAVTHMSGWNARVVTPILDILQVRAADEMRGMVGQEATWNPSGPAGSPNPTNFAAWAAAPSETTLPALSAAFVLNCWEAVLVAAFRQGAINWQWIHNLYVTVPAGNWVATMTRGARHTYNVGGVNPAMPSRGDLVFFNGLAHVAMATGTGSDVYTFWPPPNTPFTPGGTVDRVKISTIEALSNWMTAHPAIGTPTVEFASPSW